MQCSWCANDKVYKAKDTRKRDGIKLSALKEVSKLTEMMGLIGNAIFFFQGFEIVIESICNIILRKYS